MPRSRPSARGWAGKVARGFLHKPEAFLTTTLVGNNIALVGYSTLMGLALQEPLQSSLTHVFGPESAALSGSGGALVLQTIIATAVVFFFGEVLPNTLLREPNGKCSFGSRRRSESRFLF